MIWARVEGLYDMMVDQPTQPIPVISVRKKSYASLISHHRLNSRMIAEQLKGFQLFANNPRTLVVQAIEKKIPMKRFEMNALIWALNTLTKMHYTLSDIEFLEDIST